jgi:type II secretory pathway pseudopilin PulG
MNPQHQPVRRSARRSAFTLLEMIISIGLFVTLMGFLFTFYDTVLREREEGQAVSRNAQLARVVLDRMARELRQATANTPSYGPGVAGFVDNEFGPTISINTHVLPDKALSELRDIEAQPLPGQFDLRQISYAIAWDYENLDSNGEPVALGLARSETRTFLRDAIIAGVDEDTGEVEDAAVAFKRELYAPEIKFLEFHYFDGATWWPDWRVSALPQMVRITIGFLPGLPPQGEDMDIVEDDFLERPDEIDPLPPDRYSVFVRLAQADVFFGSRLTREASSFSESAGFSSQ